MKYFLKNYFNANVYSIPVLPFYIRQYRKCHLIGGNRSRMNFWRPAGCFQASRIIFTVPTFVSTFSFSAIRAFDGAVGEMAAIAVYWQVTDRNRVNGRNTRSCILHFFGTERGFAFVVDAQITTMSAITHVDMSFRERLAVWIFLYHYHLFDGFQHFQIVYPDQHP